MPDYEVLIRGLPTRNPCRQHVSLGGEHLASVELDRPRRELCGVLGNPSRHDVAPRLHVTAQHVPA